MTVNDILKYLDSLFPIDTACDFDNVGLLVGNIEKEVKKVLIALDCSQKTVENAVNSGCELIITHHPIIFEPLKTVLENSVAYSLVKNEISVISMHTNLDIADKGVNSRLCEVLEIQNTEKVIASDGFTLKGGSISAISAQEFAKHIKSKLNTTVKYIDCKKQISKVLVCSGSGGDFVKDAVNLGFDALVTSEVKHHQFLFAKDNNIAVFDAGHFETEDIIVEPLKLMLANKFPNIQFICEHPKNIKYC